MRENSSSRHHRRYSLPCLMTDACSQEARVRKSPKQQGGAHMTPHSCFPRMRRPGALQQCPWIIGASYPRQPPRPAPQRHCQRLLAIAEIWSAFSPACINSSISWQVYFSALFFSEGVLLGVPVGKGSRLIFCQALAYREKTSETSIHQSKEITWSCTQTT